MRPLLHPTLAMALACAALAAQQRADADPRSVPTTVRTLLRADDTPIPGVPVHVGPPGVADPGDVVGGWLVRADERLERLRASRVLRSDPEGRIVLPMPESGPNFAIFAGAPFRSAAVERAVGGDGFVLRVERLTQFRVRVVDHAGEPLARFPMALVGADERAESVAWSDDSGHATFAVDPATTVRLRVVPFGWCGALDGFPTVTSELPNATTPLRVPAHGAVRVRTLRGGEPADVVVHGAELEAPARASVTRRSFTTPKLHGVALLRVPVGAHVQGRLRTAGGTFTFTGSGPRTHGEVVQLDVETDPARARVGFTLEGLTAAPRRVHVRVVTDAGTFSAHADADAAGVVVSDFVGRAIHGTRYRRVDVDAEVVDAGGGTRAFSASLPLDQPVRDRLLEIGAVPLVEHEPLLRGRVLDDEGRPVANARVTVQAEPEAFSWMEQTAFTAQDGGFVVHGPLPRGDGGVVLPTRAWATTGAGLATVQSAATSAQLLGAEVTIVLARPAEGHVELSLRDLPWAVRTLLQATFVDAAGRRTTLGPEALRWSGAQGEVCVLGPLPAGEGTLRLGLRPGVALGDGHAVSVERGRTTRPAALRALDLSPFVTSRRLRVVDEQRVPLPRVTVEYSASGHSETCTVTSSDRGGFVDVVTGPPALRVRVLAEGMEPTAVEPARLADGADVVLAPRRHVCVRVVGLPAELPRDRVEVLLRPTARDNLLDVVHAPVGPGDSATLPRPRHGTYWVRVVVRGDAARPGDFAASMVHQAAEPVTVSGPGPEPHLECVLDEAAVQRLREALASVRTGG